MQKYVTRLFVAAMLMLISIITLVASTFAWVGLYQNSTIQKFEVNLQAEELGEYGIEISLDGIHFSQKINQDDLKRVILKNYGYNEAYLNTLSNDNVRTLFSNISFDQATVVPDGNKLVNFTNINDQPTTKLIKFDFYLSAVKNEVSGDTSEGESEFKLDAFLNSNLFVGTKQKVSITNEFEYPNYVNDAVNAILPGTKVRQDLVVDSASVVRCAFSKYGVVEKYKPELYNNSSEIKKLLIYQGGTNLPTYDKINNVYSVGGCLEDNLNLAIYDWNKKHSVDTQKHVPDAIKNRGDIEFKKTDLNQLVNSQIEDEQVGIDQMIKFSVHFWFEGYDADCFNVVDNSPVQLNISFSAIKKSS